ncbi:MAG: TetR/AcrR family transcriptional regulator [Firmicutes bacterium]|nr:TetR/AcrR family transcriptional regulator [Bacillota bacterium]
MSREVKEYEVRKKEILDTAQCLFLQKGYNRISIQDIIDTVGIAKGTFYHYFDSKEQLMKEIVGRIIEQAVKIYSSVADDNTVNALEKMNAIFKKIWDWRMGNRELTVLRCFFQEASLNNQIWYYLREKSIQKTTPILSKIITQGVNEGLFINDYPEETGEIIINLIFDLKEVIGKFLSNNRKTEVTFEAIFRKIDAFNLSIERILGVRPGALVIYNKEKLKGYHL